MKFGKEVAAPRSAALSFSLYFSSLELVQDLPMHCYLFEVVVRDRSIVNHFPDLNSGSCQVLTEIISVVMILLTYFMVEN